MWSMGAFSSFSLTNIARSPWTPVKGESLRGTSIDFSEKHWFYICCWIKFQSFNFLCICIVRRNCWFFFKINIIVYNISYRVHIHCILKSGSFFFFKESIIVRQDVSCTWPPVWWSVDFIPWAGSPAISLNTGHQMTCLCTGKIMTATKTEEKSYLLPTWTAQVISQSELHNFIKYFV